MELGFQPRNLIQCPYTFPLDLKFFSLRIRGGYLNVKYYLKQ